MPRRLFFRHKQTVTQFPSLSPKRHSTNLTVWYPNCHIVQINEKSRHIWKIIHIFQWNKVFYPYDCFASELFANFFSFSVFGRALPRAMDCKPGCRNRLLTPFPDCDNVLQRYDFPNFVCALRLIKVNRMSDGGGDYQFQAVCLLRSGSEAGFSSSCRIWALMSFTMPGHSSESLLTAASSLLFAEINSPRTRGDILILSSS